MLVMNKPDVQQIRDGIEALQQIEAINPEVWAALDVEERLEALQEVEDCMAEVQGRPPVDVATQETGAGTFGTFNHNRNIIHVNAELLESSDAVEAIVTAVYEGRHAYQWYATHHPGFHPNEAQVEEWRSNFALYLSAGLFGQELYQSQPVEAEAFAYEAAIRQGLYDD